MRSSVNERGLAGRIPGRFGIWPETANASSTAKLLRGNWACNTSRRNRTKRWLLWLEDRYKSESRRAAAAAGFQPSWRKTLMGSEV